MPDDLCIVASCSCCGSNRFIHRYPINKEYASYVSGIDITKIKMSVAVCSDCGHQFISPMPSRMFLNAFYGRYMSKAKKGFYLTRTGQKIPQTFTDRYGIWLSRIKKLMGPGARILDVGSGLGMFLRLAREEGFVVSGIESSSEAAKACKKEYDISVINSPFESAVYENTADIITMWDLLEHLPDPDIALQKANRLLVKGGIMVIEVPARDSVLHCLSKIMYRFSGGRIRQPVYQICGVHHLHYFSEHDIRHILGKCSFSIIEIYRGETDLYSLYRKDSNNRGKLVNGIYNMSLAFIFMIARLLNKQNKMIIFAKKKA